MCCPRSAYPVACHATLGCSHAGLKVVRRPARTCTCYVHDIKKDQTARLGQALECVMGQSSLDEEDADELARCDLAHTVRPPSGCARSEQRNEGAVELLRQATKAHLVAEPLIADRTQRGGDLLDLLRQSSALRYRCRKHAGLRSRDSEADTLTFRTGRSAGDRLAARLDPSARDRRNGDDNRGSGADDGGEYRISHGERVPRTPQSSRREATHARGVSHPICRLGMLVP